MIYELKIPAPGESINEVELARWLVDDGCLVEKDQELAEVESDKATLPLIADKPGKLKIIVPAGTTVKVGTVAATIDTNIIENNNPTSATAPPTAVKETPPVTDEPVIKSLVKSEEIQKKEAKATPLAHKLMAENKLDIGDIIDGLKKITSTEVKMVLDSRIPPANIKAPGQRKETHEKLSSLRKKISERLVAAKNQTAMLTTFNEADMSAIIEMRSKWQSPFVEKYGIKLGFMSFFVKAATIALHKYPKINSYIDGDEIITPQFCDIGIAVQTNKGLMVPVLRNAEMLTMPQIETEIAALAQKAKSFRISPEELSGGTFTITNGGVFGSLLSTPLVNPPQSGILGMHNILERPVAINGKVEVRPMMYLALSYDHRLIDGKESVGFLFTVKELVESPYKLFTGGLDAGQALLGL
ncbi:MAG: dihydrolipoyllysine-residue succinyltransferase [Bacteroidales bacterium]|nr:dihydrolipoyllysine-residue succinyltransferase [Bacteroidales bacterium]